MADMRRHVTSLLCARSSLYTATIARFYSRKAEFLQAPDSRYAGHGRGRMIARTHHVMAEAGEWCMDRAGVDTPRSPWYIPMSRAEHTDAPRTCRDMAYRCQ